MPRFISPRSATLVDVFKESRMKFLDPTKPYRNCGGMGFVAQLIEGVCPPSILKLAPLMKSASGLAKKATS